MALCDVGRSGKVRCRHWRGEMMCMGGAMEGCVVLFEYMCNDGEGWHCVWRFSGQNHFPRDVIKWQKVEKGINKRVDDGKLPVVSWSICE